jgi:hypothetical protein
MMYCPFSRFAAAMLLAAPSLALAGQWEICDYTVQIERTEPTGVRAKVSETAPQNPAICLPIGVDLRFEPESEDYQSTLPKKRWPKVGTTAALRYRQLTGHCKNDGNTQPCTIKHYSILNNR